VRAALEDDGFAVVAEATNATQAVELALEQEPDICLLDVDLPGNGIWAAAEVATRLPYTAVVMLARSERNGQLLAALRAGAVGYLLMDTDPLRLSHALRGVIQGEVAVPRRLVSLLIDELRSREHRGMLSVAGRRATRVTSREWDVAELMREGLTTAEIAERLFVSPVTVRRHVSAIVRKLGVSDRESARELLQRRQHAA
jgi:DNA-binding NarL/FixJ family response regulator